MSSPIKDKEQEQINEIDEFIKINKPQNLEEEIKQKLEKSQEDEEIKKATNNLKEQEKIDEQIKAKEEEIKEFKDPKEKREFTQEKIDNTKKNENLKDCLNNLKEQEKIDEQIKAKEEEIINKNKEDNKEQTKSDEQEDWNKKAQELEKEALKERKGKLEQDFNQSIDNLVKSDGIDAVFMAIKEIDMAMKLIMKQTQEEIEAKKNQREEKLKLAFESPKFKEAIGDLVKELYQNTKEVKNELGLMEKERNNYIDLKDTLNKEIAKGINFNGYHKIKEKVEKVEKETPNFKNTYPKLYEKTNKTLEKAKEKLKNQTQSKANERSL